MTDVAETHLLGHTQQESVSQPEQGPKPSNSPR